MGEYWKPVNFTRGEFIHPHHVDCGLNLTAWNSPGSGVRRLMDEHWKVTDDVRAVSDYGRVIQLSGIPDPQYSPDYDTIGDRFIEIRPKARDAR